MDALDQGYDKKLSGYRLEITDQQQIIYNDQRCQPVAQYVCMHDGDDSHRRQLEL